MTEYAKKDTFITPVGIFKWASLGKPDTKFKAEGEYRVTMSLPKDAPETVKFLTKLDADYKAAIQAVKEQLAADPKTKARVKTVKTSNLPYKPELDQEGNETGNVLVNFKAKASGVRKDKTAWSFKPGVFDAKRNPIPSTVGIWGGSKGKVAYQVDGYYVSASQEAGLSLKLQSAQILDLKSGSGKDAASFGFEEEAGYSGASANADDVEAAEIPADGRDF